MQVQATVSSEVTPEIVALAPTEDLVQSLSRDEGKVIELLFGSKSITPLVEDQVAESGLVAQQGAQGEIDRVEQDREDLEGPTEHTSPADRAPKRPRVEEAGASKSPPEIVPTPSDHLYEEAKVYLKSVF